MMLEMVIFNNVAIIEHVFSARLIAVRVGLCELYKLCMCEWCNFNFRFI